MFQRNLQRVVIGSALAVAATAILPVVKNTMRPVVHGLSRQMRYLIVMTKEEIEDFAAEVKFERIRKSLDKNIFIDGETYETENENRIFN